MKHPNIKTEVKHSESKNAWNVVGITLGCKYKIARVPYPQEEGEDWEAHNAKLKSEALEHAEFISYCFNNEDKVQL